MWIMLRQWVIFTLGAMVLIGVESYVLNTEERSGLRVIQVSEANKQRIADTLTQALGRRPLAAEMEQAITAFVHREILVNEALLLGIHRVDPVVQQRVLKNMAFVNMPGTADQQLAQADQLNMYRTDIVVRRRLIERMTKIIQQDTAAVSNDLTGTLMQHIADNPEQYHIPPRMQIVHGYFSTRHMSPAQIQQWYRQWQSGELSDHAMQTKATSVLVARDALLTSGQLEGLFSPSVRSVIDDIVATASTSSISSMANLSHRFLPLQPGVGGYHFIQVAAVIDASPLTQEAAMKKARQDYHPIQQQRQLASALTQLQAQYHVSR